MSPLRLHSLLILGLLLMGCAKSTVVLLDNGKQHNAIIISTDNGTQQIDQHGMCVTLRDKNSPPSQPHLLSQATIQKRFSKLLAAIPPKPTSLLLFFQLDSTQLTPASEETFNLAMRIIQERSPCMVTVIGHTDTVGSSQYNKILSKARADQIAQRIQAKNPNITSLITKGYGEEELLTQTPDGTINGENRNVEIFIK